MKPVDRTDGSVSASKYGFGRGQPAWLLFVVTVPAALLLLCLTIVWGTPSTAFVASALILAATLAWLAGNAFAPRRPLTTLRRAQSITVLPTSDRPAVAGDPDSIARAYALMSGINIAIGRTRDRDAVCAEVCRLAVERAGFRFAWLGLYDPTTESVDLQWYAGDASALVNRLRAVALDGKFPPPSPLSAGDVYVCNDIGSDTAIADIHRLACERQFASFISLPLQVDGETVAALGLYADTPGFFTVAEAELLRQVATDIALCLDYIEKEETLHQLAYYDSLTTLPNRVLFADRLDQALVRERYAERHVALIMGHIDRFKEINGALGHYTGDAVLRDIARRLSGVIRPGDTIARTGGSGFGIILTDVAQPGDVAVVAHKIAQAVAEPIMVGDREIFVTLALGIAVSPEDGQDAETLLANAAAAEHMLSNESGTRYRFYTHEVDALVRERYVVERELHRALERREFTLLYQPIVDLKTLSIAGAEALLRWHNPRLGDVAPSKFIPIAEKSGLIVPIGEWVLKTASSQTGAWKRRGLPAHISVNASAIQLKEHDFEDRARAILGEFVTDPSHVSMTLEITESNLMENPERAAKQLHRLRDKGLSISIDDFGTGYSSLSYLRRLPVDSLKIDISFVRDLIDGPDGIAIVRAVIALAHSLEMTVIAEGVETYQQLKILREAGCDAAQGYLFSPAVPAAAFEALCLTGVVLDHAASPRTSG
jgi:diguanylate cyclase